MLNFLVQGTVLLGENRVEVNNMGQSIVLEYPKGMSVKVEEIALDDPRLSNVWGPSIRRISIISPENAPLEGYYEFIIKKK